jgi:hypothetical protein
MKRTFKAMLFSHDGESCVTDFNGSTNVQRVWDNIENMGSKWVFYPIPFVFSETTNKVVGVPDCFEFDTKTLKGMNVDCIKAFIKANQDYIHDILS